MRRARTVALLLVHAGAAALVLHPLAPRISAPALASMPRPTVKMGVPLEESGAAVSAAFAARPPSRATASRPHPLPTAPRARIELIPASAAQARAGMIGTPNPGPPCLVEEKDACGVGFLARLDGTREHQILSRALRALGCMEHRGACGGDRVSGDGAGVMTAVPWEMLEPELKGHPAEQCAVAMVFLPQDSAGQAKGRSLIEDAASRTGLKLLGWREVPQHPDVLGEMARTALPKIEQASFRPSLTHPLNRSSIISLTHSLTHSPTHSPIHSLARSRTLSHPGLLRARRGQDRRRARG